MNATFSKNQPKRISAGGISPTKRSDGTQKHRLIIFYPQIVLTERKASRDNEATAENSYSLIFFSSSCRDACWVATLKIEIWAFHRNALCKLVHSMKPNRNPFKQQKTLGAENTGNGKKSMVENAFLFVL